MKAWLTTQDVAAALGITVARVEQLIAEGSLTAHHFGQVTMINRIDLEEARQRNVVSGRPPKANEVTPIISIKAK